MIIATGIDIIEIARIEKAFERLGSRFRDRVFTVDEIKYCESRASPMESYAGRFAAKEAALKALGTGWSGGVGWHDVEVISRPGGAPGILITGRALDFLAGLGASRSHLSISHSRDLAIAQVILEQ